MTALGERPDGVERSWSSVVTSGRPGQRVGTIATFAAYTRRDLHIALSYRLSFILETVSTVFQVMLFFYLSRFIDGTSVSDESAVAGDYFGFVMLGLVLVRMIDAALTSFARNLRTEQAQGTLEALLASPSSPARVVLGTSCYSLLYGVAVSTFMLLVALAFGLELTTEPVAVGAVVIGLVASLVLFAALGVVIAAFIVVYKQGMGLLGLASQVLALLGGVYFPLAVFPGWLQAIAELVPFTWTVEFLRDAALRGEVDPGRLVLLVLAALVLMPVALVVLNRAVDRARRDGSLAQY